MKAVLFDFKTAKEEWFDLAVATYTKKLNPFIRRKSTALTHKAKA